MKSRLAGKRAIVTGAGSGIGRASAIMFAAEGAQILAVDKDHDAALETVGLVHSNGGKAIAVGADAGNEAAVQEFTARAITDLGGLDILLANAGIAGGPNGGAVSLFEQPVELWNDVLRINLVGVFLAIKYAAQHMVRQSNGSIVCISSVAALRSNAGGHPYSASKAGVISLVQTAANSFAGSGVRINAICPGLIETGMTEYLFNAARARRTENRIGQLNPLDRHGAPEEIAAAATFLACEESSYVNGQAIPVDGGFSSSHPYVRRWP